VATDDVVTTGSGVERVCGLQLVACEVRDFYFEGSLKYQIFMVGTISGRRESRMT
jgi:hypothetical protein